jgi:pSer/pThr/pTyr-binding forkhead associated (FHA) protein
MGQAQGNFTIRWRTAAGEQGTMPLATQPLRVGSQSADILVNVRAVSRQHMTIALIDGHVYVTDLNSRNGTQINGLRLTPGIPQEWRPGDRLLIPDVEFELITPQRAPSRAAAFSEMKLHVTPSEVRPGQKMRLSLSYQGEQAQPVLVQAYPLKEGARVELGMEGDSLKPDGSLNGEARARRAKALLLGGTVVVRFTASAALENLFDTAQVTVRVRPRYELLLLLLLLAVPLLITRLPQFPIVAVAPTSTLITPSVTATVSPTPSATASTTATASHTPTPTATATTATITVQVPTQTPSVTPCVVQPPPGWVQYSVKAGDTLRRLAGNRIDEVVRVSCIDNPDVIAVGQVLWLPFMPQPDLVISASANGSPYWDTSCAVLSVPVSYTVTNNGSSAARSFFNNVWLQFPSGSVAGVLCGDAAGTSCQEVSLGAGQSQTLSGTILLYTQTASVSVLARDVSRQDSSTVTLNGYGQTDVVGYGAAQTCTNNAGCRVVESDENNNRSAGFSVQVPQCQRAEPQPDPEPPVAANPDLGIINLSVSLDCQGSSHVFSYSYEVYSYGPGVAPSYAISESFSYVTSGSGGGTVGSGGAPPVDYTDVIQAGDSRYFSGDGGLLPRQPLTVTVSISVSIGGSLPDNDPGDNSRSISATSNSSCAVIE